MFKKVLLATAIAAASTSAFAMQAMDEESLSATTGQDGLTINIDNTNLAAFDVYIHDTNGFGTSTFDAAITLNNIDVGVLDLTLEIDAGSTEVGGGATTNTLQIKAFNGTALVIDMGTLSVGNSNRDADTPGWGTSSDSGTLVDLGSLTIGATTSGSPLMNIQMGNEAQGTWIRLAPSFTNGLSITGFALFDGSSPTHGIGIGTLTLINSTAAPTALDAAINVDATASGLVLDIDQLGDATNGMDIRMAGVRLGVPTTSPSIGDVEIVGLNLANTTIAVIGH